METQKFDHHETGQKNSYTSDNTHLSNGNFEFLLMGDTPGA